MGINKNNSKKNSIQVNRSMVKKTFDSMGIKYASELAILNLKDLSKILDYNIANNIKVYRMSSDMFPWMSNYKLEDLPNFDLIKSLLIIIGRKAMNNNIRLSFHPGPYCVISSLREDVVEKSIYELNQHAQIMDLMELEQSNYYPINIHVNSSQPSCEESAERFCNNFDKLSDSCKKRLVVENDDKSALFTVQMLYELIYKKINIPITVDFLHWQCHNQGSSWEETLRLGTSTWQCQPLCHHASSKKLFEDSTATLQSHADYIYEKFETFDISLDIELECKMKDIALFEYYKI
jgi:UV DNA damage endonuclease